MWNFTGRKVEDVYREYREALKEISRTHGLKLEENDLGTYSDNGEKFPLVAFTLHGGESGIQNFDYYFAAGIHGDEPGTDVLLAVIKSLESQPELLYTSGKKVIIPVVSGGAYESGKRENLSGINVNRAFWIPEKELHTSESKPEEISLLEKFIKENFNEAANNVFIDFHRDIRYPNTLYALANSHSSSEDIARYGLSVANRKGFELYTGNIPETNEHVPEKRVILVNRDGVLAKEPRVYLGAYGPSPEMRASEKPPVEITLETNYANITEAKLAGTIAATAMLAKHKGLFGNDVGIRNYAPLPAYVGASAR